MEDFEKYPFEVRPLTEDAGGGWLITFPDMPGCMSDGETPQEAIENGRDAARAWLAANREMGRPDPKPGSGGAYQGKIAFRTSKSTHARLIALAKAEGVTLNTYLNQLVNQGLGLPG